jgi:hypothetical protein
MKVTLKFDEKKKIRHIIDGMSHYNVRNLSDNYQP